MSLFGRKRITINDLSVSLASWNVAERNDSLIQYDNPNGDVFSINFFAKEPDISVPLSNVDAIRNFYREMLISNSMGLIQCDVQPICGVPAVYFLAKLMLEPRGFLFLASYTIPRQKHSFVLKHQAVESGVTGMREAAVMAMLPTPEINESTNKISGWCSDPYDKTLEYSVMRNQADSEEYDPMFPDHPLTRSREFMSELPNVITLSDNLLNTPEFNR